MASVHKQGVIDASSDYVWAGIRDFGTVQRVTPRFIAECHIEGEQDSIARVITFGSGRVARALLVDVDIDDARRRPQQISTYSITSSARADGPVVEAHTPPCRRAHAIVHMVEVDGSG
jgi:hypothetical protein